MKCNQNLVPCISKAIFLWTISYQTLYGIHKITSSFLHAVFVVVSKAHTFRRYWKGIWLAVNTRVLGLLTFSSLNGNNFVLCPENKKDRRINFKFSRFNRRRLTTFITNTLSNMSQFPLQDLLGPKIQCIIFIVYFEMHKYSENDVY